MLPELLHRIAIVFSSLFAAEATRELVQRHVSEPQTSRLYEDEDLNETDVSASEASSSHNKVLETAIVKTSCSENVSVSKKKIKTSIRACDQYLPTKRFTNQEINVAPDENKGEQSNTNTIYGAITIPTPNEQPRSLLSSCKTSLWISLTITVAVIPVSLVLILVLYLDIITSNICYQQLLNNTSLPQQVKKYVITGHDIEGMALNFWFQSTLILLFGWKEFKSHYSSTLLLGFLLGSTVVIYKTALFLVDINFTQTKYRYLGNVIFLFGVIYSSYIVAKKVCKEFSSDTRRLKKRKVFAIVSTQFFLGFLIAMAYRYGFVPWFRNTKNEILRGIIAMITPTLILLPMVISENLALASLPFTDAGRIFVLVYFVNGVSILLYCIMQAGVSNLWLFIGLSFFRGAIQVFQTATVKIRQKVITGIWKCLERKCKSCPQLGDLEESSDHRRLKVDKEIQIMLYQSTAIILSQAYLVLYLTSNYHVEPRDIIEDFLMKRVLIGLGISFVANFLSLLLHIHLHKTQFAEVWYNHWKLHIIAVILVGGMSICYFTAVLLSVFKTFAQSKEYHNKDCINSFK